MDLTTYLIHQTEALQTPALIYHADLIERNTRNAIEMAGGPERLWPHVKSHKMREMIQMQQRMGITRFKCATLSEAKMLAELGARHILVAYPLVGPNIEGFLRLVEAYPQSAFYAIGDDAGQLERLSEASAAIGRRANAMIDINMGMDRTGITPDGALALYERCAALPGLAMRGMHGYDGHANDPDPKARAAKSSAAMEAILSIREALIQKGIGCELLVIGGTPSFPIHMSQRDVYLSPGTIFLLDARYMLDLTDLPMVPAAMLLTRVISHPAEGLFTLDLGSKAISTDMGERGLLLSVPDATPVRHSEEHWVFRMPEGQERPAIGSVQYVLPMHVCTTTMLYPSVRIARDHQLVETWALAARDR